MTRDVAANVGEVRERIAAAARRAGRSPDDVTLVAATKTVDVARVEAAVAAGVRDLGENRAQELLAKAPALAAAPTRAAAPVLEAMAPRWHFLGALQRNKVRALAPWVTCWQSVDRASLGAEIARRVPGACVLVEVNLGEEEQKAGCPPGDVVELVAHLRGLGLVVEGLMTVPPRADDPRPWFARLRALGAAAEAPRLSMGMTDDYEIAVEEGAAIVRVGRAIFGARTP